MRTHHVVMLGWITLAVAFVGACGSRTGLLAPEIEDASQPDAKPDVHDATAEDLFVEEDAPEEDVVFPDVPIISDCPDAGDTLVYVLGSANELYSFYPPTLTFKSIGTISCQSTSSPNSMAVTRSGIAFTNFLDGELFENLHGERRVQADDVPTRAARLGDVRHGLRGHRGRRRDALRRGQQQQRRLEGSRLRRHDELQARDHRHVPTAASQLRALGTGAGQLFGFCPNASGSVVIEIDPSNANVISSHQLAAGSNATSFAFAFWGGTFWIFSGNGSSLVTNYDPNAQTETNVAHAPLEIVGAGVSTCAPL